MKYLKYDYKVISQPIGHRCGYVRIPKTSKLYGKDYCHEDMPDFNVHGGLTFSGKLKELKGHWIGFDCAHLMDARDPSIMSEEYKKIFKESMFEGAIRTEEYVIQECKNLIKQIIKWEKK